MEVKLAETAGFCFGVNRAVDMVYQEIERRDTYEKEHAYQAEEKPWQVHTYGPIIHNEEVVREFEEHGVYIAKEEELEHYHDGVMIIRSHGISRAEQEQMASQGLTIVDATCPYVRKIHRLVERAGEEGKSVIIIGNPRHPEVQGIRGWSRQDLPNACFVVESAEDIEELPPLDQVLVVSQTTFNHNKFQELVEKLQEKGYNTSVVNTICKATQERQIEARKIAESVGTMIVIGGRNSSNTQKLYEICRNACPNTYYIQTLVDLGAQGFTPVSSVGITAGASTPNKIIEEVHTYVRNEF